MSESTKAFEAVWEDILRETAELQQSCEGVTGCRFLYSARSTFLRNTGILFAGINPGREADMSDRGYALDGRNAYLVEDWTRSPYRVRMLELMQRVYRHFGIPEDDINGAINKTLTANYMPFRSRRSSDITGEAAKRARTYSTALWLEVLPLSGIRAVVCSGDLAYRGFFDVCSKLRMPTPALLPHASGHDWGEWCIDYAIRNLTENGVVPTWPV